MCICYNIEFWTPCGIKSAEWERRVKRGLALPGQNPEAKIIVFYECNGGFYPSPRCGNITQGGNYRGRIAPFCYEDNDCFMRMVELQAACTVARRECQQVERERRHPEWQREMQEKWKKAYDEWTSGYELHRDCPDRRYDSRLLRALKRARCLMDQPAMNDRSRMGAHPSTEPDPYVGISRLHDPPKRRY